MNILHEWNLKSSLSCARGKESSAINIKVFFEMNEIFYKRYFIKVFLRQYNAFFYCFGVLDLFSHI